MAFNSLYSSANWSISDLSSGKWIRLLTQNDLVTQKYHQQLTYKDKIALLNVNNANNSNNNNNPANNTNTNNNDSQSSSNSQSSNSSVDENRTNNTSNQS